METQGSMEAVDGHFEGFSPIWSNHFSYAPIWVILHSDLFRFKGVSFVSSGRHILFHEIEKSYQKGVAEKESD